MKKGEVVEKDDRIELGDKGGKTSQIKGRYDLLPSKAIERLSMVVEEGALKYTPNNWRKLPMYDHVNHALAHILGSEGFLATGKLEELSHAACRIMMALEMARPDDTFHLDGCPCMPCMMLLGGKS